MEDARIKIEEVLRKIEHPEIAHTLFDLGMIDDIRIGDRELNLTLKVPMLGVPILEYLITIIKESVNKEFPDLQINIDVAQMDAEERSKFFHMAQEAWRG